MNQVSPRAFHGLRGEAPVLSEEVARYTNLLTERPLDLVCMGIGENGHIAFNDPPVADFEDSAWVKVVELDTACRQQQVNDGCFDSFASVPSHALTLTCPALMSCAGVVCTVPGKRKAVAVRDALLKPISTQCPASVLRRHANASLFLDEASAAELLQAVE